MSTRSPFPQIFFLSILFTFAFHNSAKAQFFKCVDSSVMNSAYCDTVWAPVCGCDNKTYRNLCEATNHNGIVTYADRTCEEITIVRFFPIPVTNILTYRAYTKGAYDTYIAIYDAMGMLRYYRYIGVILDYTETIDLSQLPSGMYVFVAEANGHVASRKFVKEQF